MHRVLGLLIILILSSSLGNAAGKVPARMVLNPTLTYELNKTLSIYESMRIGLMPNRAPASTQEEQLDIHIHELIRQLQKSQGLLSQTLKEHEGRHLRLLLAATQYSFEQAEASFGDDRKKWLASGINDVVNLVRIYQLDPNYMIYFCPNGNRSWVQKAKSPQNPFDSGDYRSCGLKIN